MGQSPERPPQGRPPHSRPPHGRPSPSRHSRYKEMLKKFDKDKDGKLNEKETEALKKYIQKRRSYLFRASDSAAGDYDA